VSYVDYVMWLLATSGVLQQLPPLPLAPDTVSVAAQRAAVPLAPAAARALVAPPDSSPAPSAGPLAPAPWPRLAPFSLAADSAAPQRPRAVEMSEAYHTRLTIHYIASFATLPLFVAEYVLGTKLYNNYPAVTPSQQSLRNTHRLVALGVAGLFAVNTVTGAWNLWDSRKQPDGALRRYLHAGLMFAADAGFVATGLSAPHGHRRLTTTPSASNRSLHRALAIGSMGTALASYAMMLIWRN
jgi:hypothetical protein